MSAVITCERCGRSTTDPDLWDPEADTGRIFCNRCWEVRDEPRGMIAPQNHISRDAEPSPLTAERLHRYGGEYHGG